MSGEIISSDFIYESHYKDVYGSRMHYIDHGQGDPILLLHSVPMSNYVWRNIIPHLSTLGRCIAPDLIGMGKSDKPTIQYSLADHIKYIEQFIDSLQLDNMTIIMHGWGSIIGLDYAMRHEKKCKGLVFYESYLCPLKGEFLSLPYQEQLYTFKKDISQIDSHSTAFIEKLLSQLILRPLEQKEKQVYCEPYLAKDSSKPLQTYVKEMLAGENDQLIQDNCKRLMKSSLPKLLLYSIPGFITSIATIQWAKENLSNIEMVDIGEALHCAQETNPNEMGETISVWLQGIEQ